MRLIDADALIADLEHDIAIDQDCLDYEELTDIGRKHIQYDKDCKQNAINFVMHTPTIEERKTGRWLPDNRPGGGFWVCSCCKFPSEAFAADKLYKYCPVCGCRMDEGGQDGR